MRVISGSLRGRKLLSLEGEHTRPTADRVKEAMFGSIQFEIAGKCVLDIFAGSGALGIEAISRGAKRAVFNDSAPAAKSVVAANLQTLGIEGQAELYCMEYGKLLERLSLQGYRFGLVFLDPPYAMGIEEVVRKVAGFGIVEPGGCIVAEHDSKILPEGIGGYSQRTRTYGNTAVTIFRRQAEE